MSKGNGQLQTASQRGVPLGKGTHTPPLGVYSHFPWCIQKCPYCSFPSKSLSDSHPIDQGRYAAALCAQLERSKVRFGGTRLVSVYFGGGTPSLWEHKMLGRVLEEILGAFTHGPCSPQEPEIEITLEANPGTVMLDSIERWAEIGINRLSLGVQSFDDQVLARLGRIHTGEDADRALRAALWAKSFRVSADLMIGTPGQTRDSFLQDLYRMLELGVSHLSVYAFTLEENTPFYRRHSEGEAGLMCDEEELVWRLEMTRQMLRQGGLEQYEISNFATPGNLSRHNTLYWSGAPYLGLGAGAHSHLPLDGSGEEAVWAERWATVEEPDEYMHHSTQGKDQLQFHEYLNRRQSFEERLMTGLRLEAGVDVTALWERFGVALPTAVTDSLVKDGLLARDGGIIKLTDRGVLFADEVTLALLVE